MERTAVAFSSGGTPNEMVASVQAAEAGGFESCWLAESCADTFSLLAACAMATDTIKLGSGIQGVFSRSPIATAIGAMTVDSLSKGRYRLGLGSGHPEQHERGNDIERRRPFAHEDPQLRLREATQLIRTVIRAASSGEAFDFEGEIFELHKYRVMPTWKPYREEIPLYFAAMSPATMQLVGEIADGVLPIFVPLEQVPAIVERVAAAAKAAGRDPAEIDIACWIPTVISDDRGKALEACRREAFSHLALRFYRSHFRKLGFGDLVDTIAPRVGFTDDFVFGTGEYDGPATAEQLEAIGAFAGTAEECAERVDAYRQAGVTLPILYLPVRTQERPEALLREQITTLGRFLH